MKSANTGEYIDTKTAPNYRHADCCLYCNYGASDNVCTKHKCLINLSDGPTICDDYNEYIGEEV